MNFWSRKPKLVGPGPSGSLLVVEPNQDREKFQNLGPDQDPEKFTNLGPDQDQQNSGNLEPIRAGRSVEPWPKRPVKIYLERASTAYYGSENFQAQDYVLTKYSNV